jgi:hypothetical protein
MIESSTSRFDLVLAVSGYDGVVLFFVVFRHGYKGMR